MAVGPLWSAGRIPGWLSLRDITALGAQSPEIDDLATARRSYVGMATRRLAYRGRLS
jgi:hypothetical protein